MPPRNEPIESEKTNDELFESLIIDGQYVPGDSRVFDEGREIAWLDMDLAQSGQRFFIKHCSSLLFAHGMYFGLGFGFKPVTATVIMRGGFKDINRTNRRLLSTIWHVLSWYTFDLLGTYAAGTKAIANIRRTHEVMRKKCGRIGVDTDFKIEEDAEEVPDPIMVALREDMKFLNSSTFKRMDLRYDPPEHMSQFSMALAQISFLLPVIAHPKAFGIYDVEGFEGFEHLWALIGHLSGIDERFNIPLQRPGREFYVRFFKEVFLPSFLVRDSMIIAIQENFFRNSSSKIPQLSILASLYYFLRESELEGFNGNELYRMMSWRDKLHVLIVRFIFAMFGISVWFKDFVNWITRGTIERILKEFAKDEEAEGRQFTYLKGDMLWSKKYRNREPQVLYKWKKAGALVDMMTLVKKEKRGARGN